MTTCKSIETSRNAPGTCILKHNDATFKANQARHFMDLFNGIWMEKRILEEWSKGIVIKIPKKGP